MACIKCGKESAAGAEFCEECLKDMERYPVKPGTPVILPKHAEYLSAKHPRKKALKPRNRRRMATKEHFCSTEKI